MRLGISFLILALFGGVHAAAQERIINAQATISPEDILRHTKKLASDEFEGRGPATHGEEMTVKYLVDEFKRMGLEPGNPNGSWFQEVPMVGVTSTSKISLTIKGQKTELIFPQ